MRASCKNINKALETPRIRASIASSFRHVPLCIHYRIENPFTYRGVFRFYPKLQSFNKPSSLANRFIQPSGCQDQPTADKANSETTTLHRQESCAFTTRRDLCVGTSVGRALPTSATMNIEPARRAA